MNRRAIIALLGLLALTLVSGLAPRGVEADEVVTVVVHPEVDVDTLALDELKLIYLGKRERWTDGLRVRPAVLKKSDVHDTFVTELLDRSPAKFRTHWKQMIFTGKGIPPKSFDSEEELLDYVRTTDGGIGYVSGGLDLAGVVSVVVE